MNRFFKKNMLQKDCLLNIMHVIKNQFLINKMCVLFCLQRIFLKKKEHKVYVCLFVLLHFLDISDNFIFTVSLRVAISLWHYKKKHEEEVIRCQRKRFFSVQQAFINI